MSRPIDADLLEPDADFDDGEFWAYSKTQIDNAPTITPERKRGRWIEARDEDPYYYICSECGHGHDFEDPFCPGCGAYMGGEQDESDRC